MPPSILQQIDDLVLGVLALARGRTGSLAVVTAGVSHDLSREEVAGLVRDRLAMSGVRNVEVRVRHISGPLRLVSVEYSR